MQSRGEEELRAPRVISHATRGHSVRTQTRAVRQGGLGGQLHPALSKRGHESALIAVRALGCEAQRQECALAQGADGFGPRVVGQVIGAGRLRPPHLCTRGVMLHHQQPSLG